MKGLIIHLIWKWFWALHLVRQLEWRKIVEWLDPKEGEKILDVGCDGGRLTLKVAEKGCEVVGIDLSEDACDAAKHFSEKEGIRCDFKVGDAEGLSFPDECFDRVYSNSALEHFQNDIKALREMHRVLKPEGIVVLTTDSLTYPIHWSSVKPSIHPLVVSG